MPLRLDRVHVGIAGDGGRRWIALDGVGRGGARKGRRRVPIVSPEYKIKHTKSIIFDHFRRREREVVFKLRTLKYEC